LMCFWKMRAVLYAIIFFIIPAVALAQQEAFTSVVPGKSGAWWLYTAYHPFGTDVRGIPVAKIRSGWCKANEFRKELFPAEYREDLEEAGSSFAIDGIFDGSKLRQTALAGVYETCKGERGAFVLLLAWPKGKPPIIRFVHEMPGEIAFTILSVPDRSTIKMRYCLECDHLDRWKWSRTKKRFVMLPSDEY
jgi:hypothetical protein